MLLRIRSRLLLNGILLVALVALLAVAPAIAATPVPQSSAPIPFSALAAIVFPGVKSAPAQYGVYLGYGLVLTNWHPWTLDGRDYTADWPSLSPSRQVPLYDDDGRADPAEDLLVGSLCDGVWSAPEPGTQGCVPFARIQGAGVLFPAAGDTLETPPVPIDRLIYASREHDIALFAISALAADMRGVTPATLSLALPGAEQDAVGPSIAADGSLGSSSTTFLTSTPHLLPEAGSFSLTGPWRVPSLILSGSALIAEGGPVFDAVTGHLLGLTWRAGSSSEESQTWVTPAALWAQALFAANDAIASRDLAAVLAAATPAEITAPATLSDPLAPALGNAGIDVTHYDLDLAIDPDARTLAGTAQLDIRTTWHGLRTFSLDATGLAISRVSIDGAEAPFVAKEHKLVIDLPAAVPYGTSLQLSITYSASPQPFRSALLPFFDIGLFFEDSRVSTLNEPDGARTWFPCNDHPSDRATYAFHLRVPAPLTAVSNGQLIDVTENADNTRTFHWQMPAPMATYVALLAVADYVAVESTAPDGIPLTHYVYADQREAGAAVFSYTGAALALLQELFGPYPFASYGHVIVPEKGMALETQAMTTMPDSVMRGGELDIFALMVHELAHQWFGNTVTPGAWVDIWLNEGFATLSEWLAAEARFGPQAAIAARSLAEQALISDSRTTPLMAPAPEDTFGLATYKKGGWLLHMLRRQLGDETFFAVLRAYLAAFGDRPARSLDLWQIAEAVSGQDLEWFFRQWLMQGDLPRYTLFWAEAPGGTDVLLCAQNAAVFRLDLRLRFSADVRQADRILNTADAPGPLHFALDFSPTAAIVDPDQDVLAQVQVQPIAALPDECPAPGPA